MERDFGSGALRIAQPTIDQVLDGCQELLLDPDILDLWKEIRGREGLRRFLLSNYSGSIKRRGIGLKLSKHELAPDFFRINFQFFLTKTGENFYPYQEIGSYCISHVGIALHVVAVNPDHIAESLKPNGKFKQGNLGVWHPEEEKKGKLRFDAIGGKVWHVFRSNDNAGILKTSLAVLDQAENIDDKVYLAIPHAVPVSGKPHNSPNDLKIGTEHASRGAFMLAYTKIREKTQVTKAPPKSTCRPIRNRTSS